MCCNFYLEKIATSYKIFLQSYVLYFHPFFIIFLTNLRVLVYVLGSLYPHLCKLTTSRSKFAFAAPTDGLT